HRGLCRWLDGHGRQRSRGARWWRWHHLRHRRLLNRQLHSWSLRRKMKIKVYVVDFETPKWVRKSLAYGLPILVILGVATAVVAMPHTFNTLETLSADNLNALNTIKADGGTYSVGATKYCGITTTAFTGNINGYKGAKQACENVVA